MGTVLTDFELKHTEPIVNVASVRHLSPFRYPGGKTWLVPKVNRFLQGMPKRPKRIIDPFTGGGSVPLSVLTDGSVEHALLYEIDQNVAAVWKSVFSADAERLCKLILNFEVTRHNVLELLSDEPADTLQRAFHTVVKNRTYRGGILASGSGLIKTGENGRGLKSRWYPQTLVARIRFLSTLKERVSFFEDDGMQALQQHVNNDSDFIFVDPPYTVGKGKRAGSRLYQHNTVDHENIFALLSAGKSPFVMTYDDDLDVLRLARKNRFMLEYVSMKNTHHNRMYELLITRA